MFNDIMTFGENISQNKRRKVNEPSKRMKRGIREVSGLPRRLGGKVIAPTQETRFDPWVGKIPLEKEMATHSSILAWRIPWTEEPSGLQSLGLQRVRHD